MDGITNTTKSRKMNNKIYILDHKKLITKERFEELPSNSEIVFQIGERKFSIRIEQEFLTILSTGDRSSEFSIHPVVANKIKIK